MTGIGFVVVAMGVFGLGEIICNLENESERSLIAFDVAIDWARLTTTPAAPAASRPRRAGGRC